MGLRRRIVSVFAVGGALALAMPAAAQFSDGYTFIKAVRDRDGDKAMEVLNKPGQPAINTRDSSTGEGALHIVVKAHDITWLNFLLARDAQVDIKDRDGNSPLMIAAQTGDVEAARLLLQVGAKVNMTNNSGETPLIFAVHRRDAVMTRLLTTNGANPAQRDTIAGKSARDYALEDARAAPILKLLDEGKPKPPPANAAGPHL